jgi:hypothetical protein
MRRRLTIIAILAFLVAAISATPAAANRGCGAIGGGHQPVPRTVTIYRGRLSCAQARMVAKGYISGRGTFHGPVNGPRSDQYVTLPGGWRCSVIEQGAADCTRGGALVGFVVD